MVKIMNVFGDEYKGRQGNAVYQGRYGKQIRRVWNDRKKNNSQAQEEQKARFRQAHAWIKQLTSEEIGGLKTFVNRVRPDLTWQQYAIKTALDRGKVSITTHEFGTTKEVWKEDWDAIGWLYRQKITLTNNNAYDLIDYQIRLELDATTVGANFDWSKQGADLRFYDSNGNKLSYYVESWDEVNKQAVLWVKVTLIPANSSTDIYMYYGSDATSESDGNAVFDFFDDFETWEGWTKYGSGIVSQSSEQARSGTYSAKKSSYADPNGAYKSLGFTLNYPFVLEAWVNRTYLSGANSDRIGVINDNGNGYGPVVTMSVPDVGIDKRSSYNGTPNNNVSLSKSVTNDWYFVRFIWNNGSMKAEVYYNETLIGSTTYTDTAYSSFTRVYIFGGYTYYVDDLRIRKYADVEPSQTWGEEEYGKIKIGVIQIRTTVTVSHSGLEAVEVYDDQNNLLVRADGLSNIQGSEITQVWEWHIDKDTEQAIGRVVYWSISGVKNEWSAGGT